LRSDNKDKRDKEEVSLSDGSTEKVSLDKGVDSSALEGLYGELREFLKSQYSLAGQGQAGQLKFKKIINWSRRICDALENADNPDLFIDLFFRHDEYQQNYIYTHSVNVCLLCIRLALELNFNRQKLEQLAISAMFHDIGMMEVSEELWNKPGELSRVEYDKVKEHPLIGEGIFTNVEGISDSVPLAIGQHQEKVDGSGYPGHLTIDHIHYFSRLISIADYYETKTHTRKWKTKVLPDKAIQELLDHQSGKYDPHFMKTLLRVVSIYPVGTFVKISSGEICKVIKTNKNTPMRPVVVLVYDSSRKKVDKERLLDLSKQLLLHVDRCIDPEEIL
jgi:HD-GYP domain-containing protein (c-di-GMP phosphodiesterase class II)